MMLLPLTSLTPLLKHANQTFLQAAAGLDTLKMVDSPAKKLNFNVADKENAPFDAPIVQEVDLKKPVALEAKKEDPSKPAVAPTIKPEEASEPLLQENPHRFVLFPIKYHEVCVFTNASYA